MFASTVLSVLSASAILVSFVSKLPQIIKVYNSKSANGISVFSLSLEVVRLSILLSYNYCNGYPPTTYIEYPLLLAQQSTLLYLALKFKNLLYTETVLFSMLLYLTIALFMTDTLPTIALNYIIVLCPTFSGVGRFSQVFRIIRDKNASSISLATWTLTFYSGSVRLIMVFLRTSDTMLLLNSVVAVLGSVSILFSALYYQNKAKKTS